MLYLKKELDILFVSPEVYDGSTSKGHYFSRNEKFWKQLFNAGLINTIPPFNIADEIIFGGTELNFNNFRYGVVDLASLQNPGTIDGMASIKTKINYLSSVIKDHYPLIAVFLHKDLLKNITTDNLDLSPGYLGKLLKNCNTDFFFVNSPINYQISDEIKIKSLIQVNQHLKSLRTKSI